MFVNYFLYPVTVHKKVNEAEPLTGHGEDRFISKSCGTMSRVGWRDETGCQKRLAQRGARPGWGLWGSSKEAELMLEDRGGFRKDFKEGWRQDAEWDDFAGFGSWKAMSDISQIHYSQWWGGRWIAADWGLTRERGIRRERERMGVE